MDGLLSTIVTAGTAVLFYREGVRHLGQWIAKRTASKAFPPVCLACGAKEAKTWISAPVGDPSGYWLTRVYACGTQLGWKQDTGGCVGVECPRPAINEVSHGHER